MPPYGNVHSIADSSVVKTTMYGSPPFIIIYNYLNKLEWKSSIKPNFPIHFNQRFKCIFSLCSCKWRLHTIISRQDLYHLMDNSHNCSSTNTYCPIVLNWQTFCLLHQLICQTYDMACFGRHYVCVDNVQEVELTFWWVGLMSIVSKPGATRQWSRHQKCKRRRGFLVMSLFMLQSGAMTILVMAPEIVRGIPLQVYINIYVCSPVFYWTGPCWRYIYIVFCVLLIVLCFIMFLLSWDRSLGRCF